jgi:glutathione S-transferase
MSEYTLYYWPLPFRGQFVRSVLAHVGASWTEASVSDLIEIKDAEPARQIVPHMGPPVLTDHAADLSLAQTQIIADANDVLYEMTLHNGAQMWTRKRWEDYRPRLGRWMEIFEEHGRRHGLTVEKGHLLGTASPGLADLVVYSLWGVMTSKLPELRPFLETSAPAIAALSDRIAELPEQQELRRRSDAEYGEEWCSGQIEASLRAVLRAH